MSEKIKQIRNIALVGHGGSGKTALAEVMLFKAGITSRLGKVEEGNTVMDFEPEELKRGSSINTSLSQFPWKDCRINIMDTPGDQNFFTDTKLCLPAADAAVVVIDAVDGVKVQTEMVWDYLEDYKLPSAIFINRLDRERSDFQRTFDDALNSFDKPKPIIIQLPIGSELDFKGVVDLVGLKAYTYDENGKMTAGDIPGDMADQVETEREVMIENIAEADDALVEKYLEGETLTNEEINSALKKGIISRNFVPVICGSATKNIGIDVFLDFIVNALPTPADMPPLVGTDENGEGEIVRKPEESEPFSAFVFKTISDPYAGRLNLFKVVSGTLGSDGGFYNITKGTKERFSQLLRIAGKEQKTVDGAVPGDIVALAKLKETNTGDTICADNAKVIFKTPDPIPALISFAVFPKTKSDEDKLFSSLTKVMEEDPALTLTRNSETKEILLSGLGQVHIETAVDKLKRKFNVEVVLETPKIPYKETIKKKVRVQGRHKKQTGGHGQFGDCWIRMEPQPRGSGFKFENAVVGGAIPKTYIPAVEKGVLESAARGILAGYPCVDFKVVVDDGSYHSVDSSEMAFKIAGSVAFKKAAEQASPTLLEPIMVVTVITPDEFMGDIMGDLNSRRGRVLGMDSKGKNQVIKAQVPLSEMQTYAPDLNSMTGGRGFYQMEFTHYDELPAQMAQKVIEAANAEDE